MRKTAKSNLRKFSLAGLAALLLLSGCSGLRVNSSPPGLEIFVDGMPTGKRTPAKIALTSGTHRVEVRRDGGPPGTAVEVRSRISVGKIVWSILLPPLILLHSIKGYRVYEPRNLTLLPGESWTRFGSPQQQQQQQQGHQGHAIQGHQAPTIIFADGRVRTGGSQSAPARDKYDELRKLKEAREEGLLNDEEHARERARILRGQ